MSDIPRIISTDDHVVEPPDLWTIRLPAKYADRAPRVERDRAKFSFVGGVFSYNKGAPDGDWCDFWIYDDLDLPVPAPVGRDRVPRPRQHAGHLRRDPPRLLEAGRAPRRTWTPTTWTRRSASRTCCPGSAGQTFFERADKELALLCVQAYNDWMIDEWCAGDGQGPAHPADDHPACGTPSSPRQEIHRCAGEGQLRRHVHREPVPARPAVGPRQGRLLGPVLPRASKRPRHDAVHAHRVVVEDAEHVARLAVHRQLDAHVPERDGLDVRLHLLGRARAVPDDEDRVLRGPGRLDAVRARAGRQAVGRARSQRQLRHDAAAPAEQLRARPHLRVHLRRRDRPARTAT